MAHRVRSRPTAVRTEPSVGEPALLVTLAWVVVALGLILRLHDAGVRSLWFDEIVTLGVPDQPWSNLLHAATIPGTNTPPLFPILFKLWMLGGTSDTWLRTGTSLIGAGIVALTWLVGRRLFGIPPALVATVLCTFSAYQITYSQYVRMYGLLALTGLISLYLLLRAVDSNRRVWWLLWSCSAAACLYTFYYAGFLLLGEAIWLWRVARHRPQFRRPIRLACTIAVLLYLPWVPFMLNQMIDGGTRAWMARPTPSTLTYMVEQFFFFDSGGTLARFNLYLVLLLAALGMLLPGDRDERIVLALVMSCGILLPYFASYVVQPFFDPRYLVYGAVTLYLFAARGLIRALATVKQYRRQAVSTSAILLATVGLTAISVLPLHRLYADPVLYRPDIRGMMTGILEDYRPGDVVVYNDPFDYLPAVWYAHQMAGLGSHRASMLYPWMPTAWVQQAPISQMILLKEAAPTSSWLPHGSGRIWMISVLNHRPRYRHAPHVASWFYPPLKQWRLARQDMGFSSLYVRLYVHR